MKAAANQGGFVTGGGAALIHASKAIDQLLQENDSRSEDWRFGVLTA